MKLTILVALLTITTFAQITGGTIVAIRPDPQDGMPGTVTATAGVLSCTATGDKAGAASVRITCTNNGKAQSAQAFTPTKPSAKTFTLNDSAGDEIEVKLSLAKEKDGVQRITWVVMATPNGGKLATLNGVF